MHDNYSNLAFEDNRSVRTALTSRHSSGLSKFQPLLTQLLDRFSRLHEAHKP